ncbi:MAG TPA: hypothetical protein ENK38_03775 [Gammaproteobacteria bacterium]|nr:hypothetical protein [Gammaproteobacteria bacterium]
MSSYKDRIRQHIRKLWPTDIPELRKFQRELFGGPNAIQAQEKHHQWLFDHNPFNDGDAPQFWIYRDDKGIIRGQQAGIPYVLQGANESWRASWGIDLMLSPEYRSRGVGAVLNSEYMETNEVTTAIGITEVARKAHCRAGWLDLGTIPLYARPISTEGVQAGFPTSTLQGRLAVLFVWPLLRLLENVWLFYVRLRGIRLEPIKKFDERVDAVWERIRSYYPILGRRDLKSLRWRFDAAPQPERYHKYYLYQGPRLRGYAVICYGKRGDRPAAVLTDFLCPPDLQKALFALCVTASRSKGANDLHCAVLSPHITTADMTMVGFLPLPHRSRFMAFTDKIRGPSRALLADPKKWFITMASSDMEWMYFLG